jgi:hypothetical protein
LIKREISDCGSNDKFTFIIDYIKDEDQKDKILRIFFIENLSENNLEANTSNNTSKASKATLVSLFLPIDFYSEFSKSTLEPQSKESLQKEFFKKTSLFKSSLNFLDNMQNYFNNNLIQLSTHNNTGTLGNLNNLALFLEEKFNTQSQTNFSSILSNKLKNQNEILMDKNDYNKNNINNFDSKENQGAISESYMDEQIAKMEDLNLDPGRKNTVQRFNEIGNRYSLSDNAVNSQANSNNPLEVADANYSDFIDKSDVNFPSALNSNAAESQKKSVKFTDEIITEILINETAAEDKIDKKDDINNLKENVKEIKIEEPIQIKKIEMEPNFDPEIRKENEEIFKLLDEKSAEMDSFFNRDWKVLEEKEGFKSFYFDEKSGLRSIKSHVTIDKNIKIIVNYLEDLSKRSTYDKNFDNGKILRKVDESHNITYLKFKGKIIISPRDFIVCARKEIVLN